MYFYKSDLYQQPTCDVILLVLKWMFSSSLPEISNKTT